MCRTSDNAAKPAAVTPVRTIPKSPPKGPLLPFRATEYEVVGTPDAILQTGLDQAVTHARTLGELGSNPRVAFSVILLANNDNHKSAEFLGNEMFFSASVLKVAAMYAAHELRFAVRNFAAEKKKAGKTFPDARAFFAALVSEFDPLIKAAALPQVLAKAEEMAASPGAQDIRSTPAYEEIFQVTGLSSANIDVEFKMKPGAAGPNEFSDNMEAMIHTSSDSGARGTIRALSYTYINAALIKAGFFAPDPDPMKSKGIWLCGDYSGGQDPFLDFHFGQNKMLAEVTTARQISRMFALIRLRKLVSPDDSDAMQDLLGNSNLSWLTVIKPPVTDVEVPLRKVGVDSGLISEGAAVSWIDPTVKANFTAHNLTGELAVCWQNLRSFTSQDKEFRGIVRVLRETVSYYLSHTP